MRGARVRDVAWNVVDALIYVYGRPDDELVDFALRVSRASWACRGRGCEPRALAAAIAYYTLRRHGAEARPHSVYSRLGIPRQSFHNSLSRLLALLGHSPMFKQVLYSRLGARVCRLGAKVLWEAYGRGVRPPGCPGVVERWPGPRVPRRALLVWRGGGLRVRIQAEFDAEDLVSVLREAFGTEYFAPKDASKILLLTRDSATRLLDALAELGMLERVEVRGRRLYRVPEEAGDEG